MHLVVCSVFRKIFLGFVFFWDFFFAVLIFSFFLQFISSFFQLIAEKFCRIENQCGFSVNFHYYLVKPLGPPFFQVTPQQKFFLRTEKLTLLLGIGSEFGNGARVWVKLAVWYHFDLN